MFPGFPFKEKPPADRIISCMYLWFIAHKYLFSRIITFAALVAVAASVALLIVIVSAGMMATLGELWWIGLIFGGLGIAIVIMWISAAEQVAVAALYLYSKTGEMPKLYQEMGMTTYQMGPAPVKLN